MVTNCAIIPKVRNKKNEVVDSKLFKDLLSITQNREEARKLYLISKNEQFIQDWDSKLNKDDNEEPLVTELLGVPSIKEMLSENQILKNLNKNIGNNKKSKEPITFYPYEENLEDIVRKISNFNNTSPFNNKFIAKPIFAKDENTNKNFIGITIEKKDAKNIKEVKDFIYNHTLNKKIRELATQMGISIGALTDLEERLNIKGVADFSQAQKTAEGFIELIRLAKGQEGENALPEEFAHVCIETLLENPIIKRLLNYIQSNNMIQEILGEEYKNYLLRYQGNEYKLAKEAAGKLLAKHFIQQQDLSQKPYKNILQRTIEAIKNFFKTLDIKSFKNIIYDADREVGELAKNILNGNLNRQLDIKNIATSDSFYSLEERVIRDKKLLKKIIDTELKRLHIYENREHTTFNANQLLLIEELQLKLRNNEELLGIYNFSENALEELKKVSKRLKKVVEEETSINDKAKVLRDIRNYLFSYIKIFKEIRKVYLEETKEADNRYGDRIKIILDDINPLLEDLFIEYEKTAMPLFVQFLKPFMGDTLIVPFGKHKGSRITVEQLITLAESDITFFDRWLDSMADSSSGLLKILDQAVKKSKNLSRKDTLKIQKQLEAAGIKLEQAGIKNQDFMFELDESGNKTGKYISKIDKNLFKEKKAEFFDKLHKKYSFPLSSAEQTLYNKEINKWFELNTDIKDGVKIPKEDLYLSKEYKSLNTAQKEFYNTCMEIKGTLDSYLPEHVTFLENAVKIRKDLLERVKTSKGISEGSKEIWEGIKDLVIRRTDDTEFGTKRVVKDFEGRVVQSLPIYYIRMHQGENVNDISTDVVSTLTAYASMAHDYKEMNKIIDVLETGRDLLQNPEFFKIQKTESGKPLLESFKTLGQKVESVITKESGERRIVERLNDFFEMQVYKRYMADEGTFGNSKIDKGKTANLVSSYTALCGLALNPLSAITNLGTGTIMMRIESLAKQFFTSKNVIKADSIYSANLPEYLAELSSRVKTSKLALWIEYFNVLQDYDKKVTNLQFDKKSLFSKVLKADTLFFMNTAGEHWMQTRTSLALADNYKMKSPSGEKVSLWDAMEVVYINPNNKKQGAELRIKPGYTKLDGKAFTTQDAFKFERKVAGLNQRMHGIYNKEDKNALQYLAIGRLAMIYRKWIKPSLNRRFKHLQYNYDLEEWTEGYYITAGRFIHQLYKDLKASQLNIATSWHNLDDQERINIKRTLIEVGHFIVIALLRALYDLDDDDNKDKTWIENLLEYLTRRLFTEIGALLPGPTMLQEGLRLVQSPTAAINTVDNILNLIGLFNPYNYEFIVGDEALLQSGRYKGHSRAVKIMGETLPIYGTLSKAKNPEDLIPFFKQGLF